MITAARQPQMANAIGLTLRDWFAAQAMSGMTGSEQWIQLELPILAHEAYRLADAMLTERENWRDK